MRWLLAVVLTSGCLSGAFGDEAIPATWPETPQLQPGSQLYIPVGDRVHQCTAGFMFRSSDNATLYLSLSAHCLGDGKRAGVGASVYDRNPGLLTQPIGTVAYDAWTIHDGSIEYDFALVALANTPGVRDASAPSVKHWGGPVGLADSATAAPGQRVAAYGASGQRGADHEDNPRLGRFFLNDFGELRVALDKKAVGGDSGGPLMTWDGRAFGLLHGGPESGIPVLAPNGLDVFTPVDVNLALARSSGMDLQLATWGAYEGPTTPVG